MGKVTFHGFQRSIEGAPDPIGIVMGANLRRRSEEPGEAVTRDAEAHADCNDETPPLEPGVPPE
jgi:hypothetical protein